VRHPCVAALSGNRRWQHNGGNSSLKFEKRLQKVLAGTLKPVPAIKS